MSHRNSHSQSQSQPQSLALGLWLEHWVPLGAVRGRGGTVRGVRMGPTVQAQGGGGGAVRRRGEAAQLIVAQLTCGLNMPEFGHIFRGAKSS